MQASVIIPVYNEGKYLVNLIYTINKSPYIKEVIVVDDGSDTEHSQLYKNIQGIRLVRHHKNLGKTSALKTGMKYASSDYVLVMDGDLTGIETNYIDRLIAVASNYDILLIIRGGEPGIFKFLGTTYVMRGEHLFRKSFIDKYYNQLFDSSRWGFDNNINRILLSHSTDKNKINFCFCEVSGVNNRIKFKKYNFLKGFILDIKMLFEVFILEYKLFGYILTFIKFSPDFKKRVLIK